MADLYEKAAGAMDDGWPNVNAMARAVVDVVLDEVVEDLRAAGFGGKLSSWLDAVDHIEAALRSLPERSDGSKNLSMGEGTQ